MDFCSSASDVQNCHGAKQLLCKIFIRLMLLLYKVPIVLSSTPNCGTVHYVTF